MLGVCHPLLLPVRASALACGFARSIRTLGGPLAFFSVSGLRDRHLNLISLLGNILGTVAANFE